MRSLVILACGIGLLGLLFWAVARLGAPAEPERLVLRPAAWSELAGWTDDDPRPALAAFRRSCEKILSLPVGRGIGGAPVYGEVRDWQDVCASALAVRSATSASARSWFEQHFSPFAATNGGEGEGLFTGYYEPELEGSLERAEGYETPLLGRPEDLVMVELGEFRDTLKGQRIAGRVTDGRLHPFEDRARIEAGTLDASKLAIAWVKDPIEAFFLQIQGSGRVRLPDRSVLRVGYDAQNGHPYTAIGRILREMGALQRGNISMRTIKDWLRSNPDQADAVMNQNASYVFFRKLDIEDPALGPLGAQDVFLTPGRSLAVDRKHHPLGLPIWLDTTLPLDEAGTPGQPFRRLMVAQDTGGAITGPVRGDVFFGYGPQAEMLAGRMKQKGRFFVLLPRSLAARAGG